MNVVADVHVLVDRERQLRILLGELRAETQRLKDDDEEHWRQHTSKHDVARSFPDIPNSAWITSLPNYKNRVVLGRRRYAVDEELRIVRQDLLTFHGIESQNEERRP